MTKPIFTVDTYSDGQRLDNYLRKQRKHIATGQIYKLIRKGQVRINGKRCQPSSKLKTNDQVRVPPFMFFEEVIDKQPVSSDLSSSLLAAVIAEDDNYLVLNKPAGIPVHTGTGHTHGVIEVLQQQSHYQHVLLAHRLDVVTSGCVVLAKSRPALLDFQTQLRARQVKKTYLALLEGTLNVPVTVKQNLAETRINGLKTAVIDPSGKVAETHFEPQKIKAGFSQVLCSPVTGRTHQIRAHAGYLQCPIVGDSQYGGSQRKSLPRAVYLHAWQIAFNGLCFQAPIPHEFEQFWDVVDC
ncbi:RluA family pseudouridine synthase [Marinicella gelatinilytica]|uniref:RluA family pseudouridine synthase n=1 Tax=Marinicella gelatinilytica TaxID=2996017 RepID=UPI002260978C|nr:RluA family pseudouridine synthase [Marinicella gelatinilytica]MCX7546054.1 RluA family pseudouridine synthase [Marinicella gelatinilytica]